MRGWRCRRRATAWKPRSATYAHRKLANGAGSLAGAAGPDASLDGRAAITAEQVEKILADRRPSTAKATVAASLLSELARG